MIDANEPSKGIIELHRRYTPLYDRRLCFELGIVREAWTTRTAGLEHRDLMAQRDHFPRSAL